MKQLQALGHEIHVRTGDVLQKHVVPGVMHGVFAIEDAMAGIGRSERAARARASQTAYAHLTAPAGGLPASSVKGLDEILAPEHRLYSPLHGLIHSVNHLIPNLYAYGPDQEPGVRLVRALFHGIGTGLPEPTNLGRKPGAHLSAGTVGRILATLHAARDGDPRQTPAARRTALASALEAVITNDPAYMSSLEHRRALVASEQKAMDAFEARYAAGAEDRARAAKIENTRLATLHREARKLKSALKKAPAEGASGDKAQMAAALAQAEEEIAGLQAEVRALRDGAPGEQERKQVKQRFARTLGNNDVDSEDYRRELGAFAELLAESFLAHDVGPALSQPTNLLPHLTVSVLLAHLWQKTTSRAQLRSFFEALAAQGLADGQRIAGKDASFWEDRFTEDEYRAFVNLHHRAWHKGLVVRQHVAEALSLVLDKPVHGRPAPLIPWNQVRWVAYSDFPDCAENAIRNVVNQVAFDRDRHRYDPEILRTLKATRLPGLSEAMIAFYERYQDPLASDSDQAARDWQDVVSGMNARFPGQPPIRYRINGTSEIAGSFANSELVIHRLFGLTGSPEENWQTLLEANREVTGVSLTADRGGLDGQGYGSFVLSDGEHRWEVRAQPPIHLVITEPASLAADSKQQGSSGALDAATIHAIYRDFVGATGVGRDLGGGLLLGPVEDLMSGSPSSGARKGAAMTRAARAIARASIALPWLAERGKAEGWFARTPAHHGLLFCDLSTPEARKKALALVAKGRPTGQAEALKAQLEG